MSSCSSRCLNVCFLTIGAINILFNCGGSGVLPPSQSPMPSFHSFAYLPSFSSPSRCSSSRVPSSVASEFMFPRKSKRCDLFRVPSVLIIQDKSQCVYAARVMRRAARSRVSRARGRVRERFSRALFFPTGCAPREGALVSNEKNGELSSFKVSQLCPPRRRRIKGWRTNAVFRHVFVIQIATQHHAE